MTDRPYSRVYYEIVGHPRFARVYRNPGALGTWLQLLLTADAMYPMTPQMPPRTPTVRLLIDAGLVIERPPNCYTIRGLEAERERRSASARNAAAVRWQSEGNAKAMPRRDETRRAKDEQIGANALPSGNAMGFRPKVDASLQDVERQHEEEWTLKCADCDLLKRKHPSGGDHPFRAELRSVS